MKLLICAAFTISTTVLFATEPYDPALSEFIIEHTVPNGSTLGTTAAGVPELTLDLRAGSWRQAAFSTWVNVNNPNSMTANTNFLTESNGSAPSWHWYWTGLHGTNYTKQMSLGGNGSLTLFSSGNRSIELSPSAGTIGKIEFKDGVATQTVLTQEVANGLYLGQSGGNVAVTGIFTVGGNPVLSQASTVPATSLALAGGNTTRNYSVALGSGASVTSNIFGAGVAIGRNAIASNFHGGTAIGYSVNATGTYSLALGYSSTATGHGGIAIGSGADTTLNAGAPAGGNPIAIGSYPKARGNSAIAFGTQAWADGYLSISMGRLTVANGVSQTVIGRFNNPVPAVYEPTEANFSDSSLTFILGNGYSVPNLPSTKKNVMTVRRDDGVAIGTGVSSGSAAQVVVGSYNDPTNAADAAFVVGTGYQVENGNPLALANYSATATTVPKNALVVRRDGSVEATGGVISSSSTAVSRFDGPVRIAPQGDISMGGFEED